MKKTNFSRNWKCKLLAVVALSMFSVFAPQAAETGYGVASAQQDIKVNGVVKDASGEPIIGASVVIKGTSKGAITNFDGNFAIDAKPNQVLVISYVGYSTQEVKATGNVNVVLQEDAAALDDVVVLGYGAAARKQDLSSSVGVISDASKLAIRPVASTEGMLQGQLAGVTVTSNGGDPTSTPGIVIRGQGSMNGDNVLWVVDGVPGAPIPSMYDIESIVVLKDAASAAIYGATSGAGGCVLVTTKKAKEGNTSLSYEGTYGVRQAVNVPHALTAEGQIELAKVSYANAGASLPDGWNTTKNPYIATTRTDWMDEVFRTAAYQRHNVVLNSGSASAKHRLSYAYDDDQGTLRNTYNKKNTLHYTGEYDVFSWLKLSEDFTWRNSDSRGTNTDSPENGVLINALHMPSSASVYNEDGSYGGITAPDNAYPDIHGDAINPVRLLEADNTYNRTNQAWTTTTLQIHNIIPGLKFTSRYSFNLANNLYKNFTPIRSELGKPMLSNSLEESTYRYSQWKTENTLTYDNSFGKHTVGALLSTTADKMNQRGIEVNASGIADESPFLQYLAYASSKNVTDYLTGPDANVAIIARGSYSYDDRYFVTASWRRDYAGRLNKDNNYGDFPAFTGAWKVSNEKFFEGLKKAVNLLKIRASWGRVGNLGSIGYGYKVSNLSNTTWDEQAQYGVGSNILWGNLTYFSKAVNPNLTWETSEQLDLGLDFAFFNNRLSGSIEYYNKRTFNLIQYQSTGWPATMGVDAMLVNLGEVKNKGIELQLGWNDMVGSDFSYYLNGNFSWQKNEITDTGLGEDGIWTGDVYGNNNWKFFTNLFRTTKGQALNTFYLIKSDGIFQSDEEAANYKDKDGNRIQPNAKAGDLKFIDLNGDGKIDDGDRDYCGSSMPKYTFALSGGFTWKNFSVSAMLQGVAGAKALFVGKFLTLNDTEGNFNRWDKILDAWSPTNTNSDIPRISKSDDNGNFTTPSDWYLEDASYLRLKNLTVGYDFTNAVKKCALSNYIGSLYLYASGENLFTLTGYSGADPECGGFDTMKYPVSRVLSIGVKIGFNNKK